MPKGKKPKEEASQETVEPSSQSFSKRKIQSNWSIYEKDLPTYETEDVKEQYDFSYLASNSNSSDFFQLSSEKEWEKTNLKPDSKLFSLDLKTLSAGLSCIPFYERIGLDENLLAKENVEKWDAEARRNVVKHKPIFDKLKRKNINVVKSEEILVKPDNVNNVIEEMPKKVDERAEKESDDELEEWLDGVLDL